MNKSVSKKEEITKKPRSRNNFLIKKGDIGRKVYNKQCNFVVRLLSNEKRTFIIVKVLTDNTIFWKIARKN